MREFNYQKHEGQNLDILFVIVLYKIKLEQSATYLSILNSLNSHEFNIDLLVYDNSPDSAENPFNNVSKLNITYITDKANSGVSKAYNTGAEFAVKLKKKWLLLLDQDTDFPAQTIREYLSAIKKYPNEKLYAPIMLVKNDKIISPCYFKFMRGFAAQHVDTGVNSLNKYSIINCGMCVDLDAFYKNGGYNELLKLDFSDHDFIRRFKKNVTNRFVVIDLKVKHHLSTETKNSFNNDKARFNYYLNASSLISNNWAELVLIKINVLMRTFKLSAVHKTFYFISKLFNV